MHAFKKRLTAALTFAVALSTIVISGAVPALADPVPYSSTPIDSWGTNGPIWAVEIVGSTIFVGGQFTQATDGNTSQPRQNLAAFNLNTGALESFAANVTGTGSVVRALESNGTDLWVGGRFSAIGGQARKNLAEVKVASGAVDGMFKPEPTEIVNSLLVDGANLYVGGLFTKIGPSQLNRNQIAKITTTTGAVFNAFRANADPAGERGNVWDLDLNGNTLYAVGGFTEFQNAGGGGPQVPRKFIAALNKDTGIPTSTTYPVNTTAVISVEYDDGLLYVGTEGNASLPDDNLMIAFNASSGAASFRNGMDGDIQAVEVVAGSVLYGSHDGFETNNDKLLAADAKTGKLEVFRPEILPTTATIEGVRVIQSSSPALVVAGEFNTVAGVELHNLAIFKALSGPADTTPPTVPGNLRAVNVGGNSATLAWNPSTDNVAVSSYEIYRDGNRVGTATSPTFTDVGLTNNTTYAYQVRAVDTSSNVSGFASLSVKTTAGGGTPGNGRFVDDDDSVFEEDIEWLAAEGVTFGCNPPVNDRFCPEDNVTRGQMAAFLVRFLGLTDDGGGNGFVDDNGSVFEADIAKLAAAGITRGCNPPANDRFCPDDRVTRGQMAAFLTRALSLTDDGGGNSFVDDNGNIFEVDIAKLAAAGVTRGCNPPANDRFCPDDAVTRGQMAAFLHRADTLR